MKLEMFVSSPPVARVCRDAIDTPVTRVEAMLRPWAISGGRDKAFRALRKCLLGAVAECEENISNYLEDDFSNEMNFNGSHPVPAKVIVMCAKRMLEMATDLNGPSSAVPFYIVARDVELIARAVLKLIPKKLQE